MNKITYSLIFSDTFFGWAVSHDFEGSFSEPGFSYSKSQGFITLNLSEAAGVLSTSASVFGLSLWSASFSEKDTHPVDVSFGSGSVKGTIQIA